MISRAFLVIPSQKGVYGMPIGPTYPPLGILYIAGVLEKMGLEVRVADIDAEKLTTGALAGMMADFNPDIVGITATTPEIKEAFGLADLAKAKLNKPVMLGGIHATMNPESCMACASIDFVVKGEGEDTVRELVMELGSSAPRFDSVKGLFYRENGIVKFSGERELIADLDKIPFPARHLLRDLSAYRPPDAERLPVVSIMTTRGCPGRCTYCCTKNIFRDRYRMRSVDNVLSEIDGAIKDFGAKEIHIADDAFNVNKKRTLEICEAIRAREYGVNFEFLNGLRADTLDDDMLDAFRSIGIRNVGFGVESANEGILKNVKKNIMPHTVEKAVAIARKKGFKTWAFFMVGLPGENKDTIKETISFARRMDPDFAKFLIFKPFPGSDIYNDIKDEGLIDDFDPADYGVYTPPVHHLKSMSAAEMIKWQKRAFRAFYFRPSKIWSHLRRQHSISQLKLSLRGLAFVIFNAFKSEKRSALHKKSPEVLI